MRIDWRRNKAARWRNLSFHPIQRLEQIRLEDLIGIDEQKQRLLKNTQAFLAGNPAEHALLWGARGTGKSSLIKAVFNHYAQKDLRIIELMREDISSVAELAAAIAEEQQWFIVFCDDLVFQLDSDEYRALRFFLHGSIELPPPNMLLYVTSNLRYILPQDLADNEEVSLHNLDPYYGEQVENKLALADRFGLWLSFYAPSKENYLAKIEQALSDEIEQGAYNLITLRQAALDFAQLRATRNYRTAEQFMRQLRMEGSLKKK